MPLRPGAWMAAACVGAAMMFGSVPAMAQRPAPSPVWPPVERREADVTITRDRAFWMGIGLGVGTSGIALAADASYWNSRLHRLRIARHDDYAPSAGQRVHAFTEVALLMGRGGPVMENWGSVAGGIGVLAGHGAAGAPDDVSSVGVAAEAQLVSRRIPHAVLNCSANLNRVQPFATVMLSLPFGTMPFGATPGRTPPVASR